MIVSEEHFVKFKKLYREELGDEEYNKKTDQQLFESATALITLMEAVYKHQNRENDTTLRV